MNLLSYFEYDHIYDMSMRLYLLLEKQKFIPQRKSFACLPLGKFNEHHFLLFSGTYILISLFKYIKKFFIRKKVRTMNSLANVETRNDLIFGVVTFSPVLFCFLSELIIRLS